MTSHGVVLVLAFFGLVLLVTRPMGAHLAQVFEGRRTWLDPLLRPLERGIYRVCGVDPGEDMRWTTYAVALFAFSVVGMLLSYILLRMQGHLPLNPQGFGAREMTPDLAFNTAASFTTNTNWQSYVPETTVSYFSNMVALAVHNWTSAASGMAVAVAFVRGLVRRGSGAVGNFWVDVTRGTLYVLLPLSLVGALVLIWQGVPQNFDRYTQARTLEGATQVIAQGPVASQEIIKELGTNGGGFFNANSAHPYENPTPLSNLLQMLAIFLIPAGMTFMFGRMAGNTRQGWAIFAAMSVLFLAGALTAGHFEQSGTPQLAGHGVEMRASPGQPGGNMEGKETRFGIAGSSLFATVTTDASCGAVNSMHDSFTPIGGLVPMANILTGEVIFGGVGAGLYGMLMFAILAVFIAGLMVGRTPEYLGKKIEPYEVKMVMLAVLVLAACVLGFTALATGVDLPQGHPWNRVGLTGTYLGATWNNVNNGGPHGFSEILYAFDSAAGNNGSAFAGITANTPFYNFTIGLAMLAGRFLMIIPLLAVAGSLSAKKVVPASAGTFPTDGATFVVLLVGIVLIVGALTYFPALSLGPIVEHFQMHAEGMF
ncbi:MAG: potassium-transporting ATPase subunit KdpA [Candidatus Eisenbacteria bacterium]|nr:potassium-transporting ATPase subunit KdpA [Candidatus Eisenbacteria bacterium]